MSDLSSHRMENWANIYQPQVIYFKPFVLEFHFISVYSVPVKNMLFSL